MALGKLKKHFMDYVIIIHHYLLGSEQLLAAGTTRNFRPCIAQSTYGKNPKPKRCGGKSNSRRGLGGNTFKMEWEF